MAAVKHNLTSLLDLKMIVDELVTFCNLPALRNLLLSRRVSSDYLVLALYCRALASRSQQIRDFAVRSFGKETLTDKRSAIAAVACKHLTSKGKGIRLAAVRALDKLIRNGCDYAVVAVAPLRARVNDEVPDVRVAAATVLEKLVRSNNFDVKNGRSWMCSSQTYVTSICSNLEAYVGLDIDMSIQDTDI